MPRSVEPSSSRPTQKDIARAAGVTQATVSLALRNHPAIKPETVALVHEAARKLGYSPDPYLSGLSSYRKRIRPPELRATLAWLSNDADGSVCWKNRPAFEAYHTGAAARAAELGYRLEDHCLRSPGMTPSRLAGILHARGIQGLLLAPQPQPSSRLDDFPFDHFSAVTFGYTLAEPRLHLVTWHQFRAMEMAFRRLLSLGYRRPGLALAVETDERSDRNWSSAFRSEQGHHLPAARRVPSLVEADLTRERVLGWFRRYRPDVVLAMWPCVRDWLAEAGVSVPQDTGFALLSVPEDNRHFSGLCENPRAIGAKAVEFVVDMIHRFETGIPAMQVCMLVEGSWCDGTTLLPRNREAGRASRPG
ncbi:transcriptional regulator [Opitutaceae bacterium TAV1]|nr:transcriptional regulator [Opitutaceae bacterium TAV1]